MNVDYSLQTASDVAKAECQHSHGHNQKRLHNGCFLGILSKKYLRQISILGAVELEIWKKLSHQVVNF
mgnify:CR=1 FL=1